MAVYLNYSGSLEVPPAVRMTQKSIFMDERAQAYLAWKESAGLVFANSMAQMGLEMAPARTPLQVHVYIGMPKLDHRCDADNQLKAILDAANKIVFKDDSWVDISHVERYQTVGGEPWLEVCVKDVSYDGGTF